MHLAYRKLSVSLRIFMSGLFVSTGLFYGQSGFSQPTITSVTPGLGPVGTPIIIKGGNFDPNPINNTVYFGAVKAAITSSSANELVAIVPNGATYRPITVTVNNLTGYSNEIFISTFPDGDSLSQYSLAKTQNYQTGDGPLGVQLGDFDGDGKTDIAVVSKSSHFVSVYRNTSTPGNISFATKLNYSTGSYPGLLDVGDIDGDGKLDIVVTNDEASSLSVYRNTSTLGNISFASKIDFSISGDPIAIILSDLDRDGKPEIVATMETNFLSVLRNTSNGTTVSFATGISYMTGVTPTYIAAGDLDGDGMTDLAVSNMSSASISLFRNTSVQGQVSLAPKVDFTTTSQPRSVAIGDLDGDGKLEIAATGYVTNLVSVFKNTSVSGQFSFAPKQDYGSKNGAMSVAISDINGDSKPDLAIVNQSTSRIVLLENKTEGGNISFGQQVEFLTNNSTPMRVAVGDLDGDSKPDLAVTSFGIDSLSIFRNTIGEPTLHLTSFSPTSAASGATIDIKGKMLSGVSAVSFGGVPAASFNIVNDTLIKAVVGEGASGSVIITSAARSASLAGFIYTGPTIFSFSPSVGSIGSTITIKGRNFTNTTAVRFGGTIAASFSIAYDSVITAIVGVGSSGDLTVTSPNGIAKRSGFTFTMAPTIHSFTPAAGPIGTTVTINGTHFDPVVTNNVVYFGAARATVTGGSATQLVVTVPAGATFQPISVTTGNLIAYSNKSFCITFPGGDVAFTGNSFTAASKDTAGYLPDNSCVSDLDGDQKNDVVVVNSSSNASKLSIFRNTSVMKNISFAGEVALPTNTPPVGAAAGDLDGDSKPDLVAINGAAGFISLFRNTSVPGSISFEPQTNYETESLATSVVICDFNYDGKPDLAVVEGLLQNVSVYRNISTPGNIAFAPRKSFATANRGSCVTVGDLDGDGKVDMAVTSIVLGLGSGYVSVFRNTSTNESISFENRKDYIVGINPIGIQVGDLNNDGKSEIVVANGASNFVSIYRNISTAGFVNFVFSPNLPINDVADQTGLAMADLNGDGRLDFVVSRSNTSRLSVFKNTGTNTNLSFAPPVEYTGIPSASSVTIADLNEDGRSDLLSTSLNSHSLYTLCNTSSDARIVGSGNNPVTGNITTTVTIDPSVQTYNGTPYVQRHYEIIPVNNPATATATITLYFTQQDFNNYNAYPGHGVDLPVSPDDALGKANLRIYQYHGFSATGLPGSYSGSPVVINPNDDKIVWNAAASSWEITFDVNGFSGFFLSSVGFAYTTVPAPVIAVSGSTTFCQGEAVMLTSSAVANNQWFKNGVKINGAAANTYQAHESGVYTVTTFANEIVSAPSAGVIITVNPIPAKPIITSNGLELSSSATIDNQWYKDGSVINGAVNQIYKPLESGSYAVKVTSNGCQSSLSDYFNFIVTGIINIDDTHFIRLGPNPVTNQVTLQFNLAGVDKLNFLIIDLQGKTVKSFEHMNNGSQLRLGDLIPGMYIVKIYSNASKINYIIKLLKQ